MRRAGITSAQLADALSVSPQAVGKWQQSGAFARAQIAGICMTLRCTADELLGLTPIRSPSDVADARGAYNLLDDDAKAMLEAYKTAAPDVRQALRTLAALGARTARAAAPTRLRHDN